MEFAAGTTSAKRSASFLACVVRWQDDPSPRQPSATDRSQGAFDDTGATVIIYFSLARRCGRWLAGCEAVLATRPTLSVASGAFSGASSIDSPPSCYSLGRPPETNASSTFSFSAYGLGKLRGEDSCISALRSRGAVSPRLQTCGAIVAASRSKISLAKLRPSRVAYRNYCQGVYQLPNHVVHVNETANPGKLCARMSAGLFMGKTKKQVFEDRKRKEGAGVGEGIER